MADLDKIKRNIGRMVSQSAPEADIDEYIKSEGVTLDQVKAHKVGGPSPEIKKEADFRERVGGGGFGLQLADTLSFGAFNPVSAGVTAAAKSGYKALTGAPVDIGKDYRDERDTLDEMLKRSRDNTGALGTAGEIALSIPFMGGGRLAAGTTGAAAVAQPVSRLGQYAEAAQLGAIYGGAYGFNSARGGVGEHIDNTVSNALGGAVAGPVLKAGFDTVGGASRLGGDAWRWATGRRPSDVNEVTNRLSQFAEAGVRPFGPALAESATQRRTAEGLANSVFGAPLRREAAGAVDDATLAVQRAVRGPIDHAPVNDAAADIQSRLKTSLADHSTSSEQINAMPEFQLRRMAKLNPNADPETPVFTPGASKESYPTEFSSAYEQVARATPNYMANPMGGATAKGRSEQTRVKDIVSELASEGKRRLHLKGQAFDDVGAITPEFQTYLESRIGREAGMRLSELSRIRPGSPGQAALSPQALKELRTEIRQAAQRAESPPYPEMPRTAEASWLRRLHGALTEDMDRFARKSGGPAPRFQTETAAGEYVGPNSTRIGDMPPSDVTVYVRPEHLDRLTGSPMPPDMKGAMPATRQYKVDGNSVVVRRTEAGGGPDEATRIPFSNKPEVGLRPVQLWADGSRVHYGAPITARDKAPGEVAADLMRGVDSAYAKHLTEIRQPLGKLFGTKVEPLQAMDRLVAAAQEGNLTVLRPYMRVMKEKGDPNLASGAIIAHLTKNAEDLQSFVKGYQSLNPAAKKVLFSGTSGAERMKTLDQLSAVSERLAPFEAAIKSGGGINFANRTNIAIGASAIVHFVPAMMMGAGAAATARFLSSPRYVQWMIRTSNLRGQQAVDMAFGRLGGLIQSDTSLPDDMKEALRGSIVGKANAASPNVEVPQDAPTNDSTAPVTDVLGEMGQMIGKAANAAGIDPGKSSPQDVINAAWQSNPSDEMANAIEVMVKRYKLKAPWENE